MKPATAARIGRIKAEYARLRAEGMTGKEAYGILAGLFCSSVSTIKLILYDRRYPGHSNRAHKILIRKHDS